MVAQLEQGQHLLGTRHHGELLGGDRVEARGLEHREQVALDVRPRLLEPQLRVHLLHPEPLLDLDRLAQRAGRRRDAQGVGQRVGGIGREHERAVPGRGGEGGRPRGERRLADAALAGEQEDPHGRRAGQGSDSTRCLSPFSAVSMRIFSPLRLIIPMSGIETSRASR